MPGSTALHEVEEETDHTQQLQEQRQYQQARQAPGSGLGLPKRHTEWDRLCDAAAASTAAVDSCGLDEGEASSMVCG